MPKTKKYVNMILKFADILRNPGFGMATAADELKAWVTESRVELLPLDVRHCAFFPRHVAALHDSTPLLPGGDQTQSEESREALPLEPAMGRVSVTRARKQQAAQKRQREEALANQAENEATFKSTTVSFLMKEQHFELEEASRIATIAWKKMLSSRPRRANPPRAPEPVRDDSDHEAQALDVQQQGSL